jgi:two-component system, chemotaxis family, protein-glutamate methylesterase/glutaminase
MNAADYGRSNGGVTDVQNPVDAQHPSMPLNAINNMEVDHTVNIPDMPALLSQLVLEDGTGESIPF